MEVREQRTTGVQTSEARAEPTSPVKEAMISSRGSFFAVFLFLVPNKDRWFRASLDARPANNDRDDRTGLLFGEPFGKAFDKARLFIVFAGLGCRRGRSSSSLLPSV